MRLFIIILFLFCATVSSANDTLFVSCHKHETAHVRYSCLADRESFADGKLMIASVGYHELFVNGKKVDDRILSPAQSRLDVRVLSNTYNLQHLLKKHGNVIIIDYAPGWSRFTNYNGKCLQGFFTDLCGEWRYSLLDSRDTGEKKYKDMGGELISYKVQNTKKPTFTPAIVSMRDTMTYHPIISEQRCPPTKVLQTWNVPSQIVRQINSQPDKQPKYVFPKNFTGWVNIRISDTQRGDTIRFRLADDPDGKDDFLQWNYSVSTGGEIQIQNRFNYMAGRYLFIEGIRPTATIKSIQGLVIGTDLKSFERNVEFNGDTLLQSIYDTDLWTFRMCTTEGYTSDCPHRERLGYGEVATACSWGIGMENYDAREMYKQNIINWIDTQQPDGRFMYTAPQMWGAGGAMWASAPLNIAWEGYQRYHDMEFLTLIHKPARKWLDFLHNHVKEGVLTPYHPHRMHYLGDWGTAEGEKEYGDTEASHFFNNCVYVWNLKVFIALCEVLGEDATIYKERLSQLVPELTRKYYHPDKGYYSNGLQVAQAFALWQDIVPDSIKEKVEKHFRYQLTTAQPYLGMGSSGLTPLLRYLCQHPEYNDIVLRHLHSTTKPSYGYFIQQGETCWPEYWSNNVPSKIHTCYTGISKLITTILLNKSSLEKIIP